MDDLSIELKKNESEIHQINTQISERVADFNTQLSQLQQKDVELRQKIKEAMEISSVKKFENDFVSVTYVAPTTRVTFDSSTFKETQPELYQRYSKTSEVKGSIRIKVK